MGKKILIGTKIGILVAIAIVGVILLSGCIEEPQKNNSVNTSSLDIFFPVQKTPADVCMSALLKDELVIDKDGCLRAGGCLLIWPYGFSLKNESGVIYVIDDNSQPIASVGDKIKIGGGETPGAHEWGRCPGPYFIVCKYGIKVI